MWPFGKSTEKRLRETLKENGALKKHDVKVDVKKKTAIFSGEVPQESLKKALRGVAEGINGIKEVDLSGVKVKNGAQADGGAAQGSGAQGAQSTAQNGEDPSAKAKAAHKKLKGESSLANNPLDVLQKGSTVILRGAVDSQDELDKAKKLASSVEGVSDVDVSGLQVIQNASKLNVTDDDGDVVYTVESGDTLSHIALHYYGDAGQSSYMKIAEANGLDDPDKIQVGQKLKIPGTTKGPETQVT